MKPAGAIVSADVVPNDRSEVPNILLLIPRHWRTDQHETTFVVMAVVVLKQGVPRVVVRIESFAVQRGSGKRRLILTGTPNCLYSTATSRRCNCQRAGCSCARCCAQPERHL